MRLAASRGHADGVFRISGVATDRTLSGQRVTGVWVACANGRVILVEHPPVA